MRMFKVALGIIALLKEMLVPPGGSGPVSLNPPRHRPFRRVSRSSARQSRQLNPAYGRRSTTGASGRRRQR